MYLKRLLGKIMIKVQGAIVFALTIDDWSSPLQCNVLPPAVFLPVPFTSPFVHYASVYLRLALLLLFSSLAQFLLYFYNFCIPDCFWAWISFQRSTIAFHSLAPSPMTLPFDACTLLLSWQWIYNRPHQTFVISFRPLPIFYTFSRSTMELIWKLVHAKIYQLKNQKFRIFLDWQFLNLTLFSLLSFWINSSLFQPILIKYEYTISPPPFRHSRTFRSLIDHLFSFHSLIKTTKSVIFARIFSMSDRG